VTIDLIGALTTLLNTVAPNFYAASDFDSRMALIHNPIYASRQWVLLVHPTALFCSALDRSRPLERWLYWSGMATVVITAIMLIGSLAGLERWSGPIVTWTYPPLMTAHRTLAGLWLLSSARGIGRSLR
jgi:hypothetical protein